MKTTPKARGLITGHTRVATQVGEEVRLCRRALRHFIAFLSHSNFPDSQISASVVVELCILCNQAGLLAQVAFVWTVFQKKRTSTSSVKLIREFDENSKSFENTNLRNYFTAKASLCALDTAHALSPKRTL